MKIQIYENCTLRDCIIKLLYELQNLTVTFELHTIPPHPRCSVTSSLDSIGTMSLLAKTTTLTASRCESTAFPVFVDRVDDPVNLRIIADFRMGWVNKNNFVVFHCCVLIDPIGVQNTEIGKSTSNLLFCNTL
mmetsp:Transcript_1515/g.1618  ORF Transcript_1515/g.1618 Transcript_1515/m.1618 type:complete len:133 (+) Transcript_1515:123-521(+)